MQDLRRVFLGAFAVDAATLPSSNGPQAANRTLELATGLDDNDFDAMLRVGEAECDWLLASRTVIQRGLIGLSGLLAEWTCGVGGISTIGLGVRWGT